jgi:hypothetical protein
MNARLALASTVHGPHFDVARVLPAVTAWFAAWKIQLWPHLLQVYYDPLR